MKNRISPLITLISLFFSSWMFFAKAQVSKPLVNVQSPNATSFGLYGEVPVSLSTGLPNIEVPLYQFNENGLVIPISLNYHSSGFRPDMHPGWVGMGWTLNSGGMVTRIVKDEADEYKRTTIGIHFPELINAGFYFNYEILNSPNWNQISYMQSITRSNNCLMDTEPDEFSFSFPGCNGKFYLDHTRTWRVKCDKPVKVTFNNQYLAVPFLPAPGGTRINRDGNFKSFSGFTITDEMGTKFIFGGNTDAIEYEMGFFNQNDAEWVAQGWHLTKIIHADGYEVNLNYEKDDYINQMYISVNMNLVTRSVGPGGFLGSPTSCYSFNYASTPYYFYDGKLISPSYLRSITGANCTILFDRSTSTELRYDPIEVYNHKYNLWNDFPEGFNFLPYLQRDYSSYPICLNKLQWKKLDEIRIQNGAGMPVKSFVFSYTNNINQRLTLLSLTEKGKVENIPPYQFFYDTSLPLPPYLANKSDHWGFYNGTFADFSNQSNFVSAYYSYREPNAAFLKAGTLNKIIYPSGGVTEFEYEPHQYSKRLQIERTAGIDATYNSNTVAGGLRIKKISSFNEGLASVKNTKEYFYVNGFSNIVNPNTQMSSGILGGQIKYYFDDYRANAFNCPEIIMSKSIFTSQSVLPVSNNSMGNHCGYSEVAVKLNDASYTRYFYTNFDNGHIDEPVTCLQISRTPYEPATSLESERGVLLREEQYSSSNVLLRKRALQYIPLNKSNEYVRSMSATFTNACPGFDASIEEGVAYKLYTYSYIPENETITVYDKNGQNPLITQRNMTYNSQYRQLMKEDFKNSKEQSTITYYRYPYDVLSYVSPLVSTANETTAFMIQNNYIGIPIETIQTKMLNGFEYVTQSSINSYKSFSGLIKPGFNYIFQSTLPILKSNYSNYAG